MIAAPLLVAHQAEQHVARRRGGAGGSPQEGGQHHGHAALHVERTASPDVAVGDLPAEGRSRPAALRGDHIDVALQEQWRRESLAWQSRDQIGSLGVLGKDPGLKAGIAQHAGNPLDAHPLLARRVGGVEAEQPLQQLDGRRIDGTAGVHRHGHHRFSVLPMRAGRNGVAPSLLPRSLGSGR